MATRTITFTHKVGGVLTNATSVVLSDPTGAYGVKRNDTSAVVVADGTALTNSSTGIYSYTFTEPADGLAYTAYVEWVYVGETFRVEKQLAANTAYTGRYTTLSEITTFLDSLNYAVHTDADRDGNSDLAAAVQGHKSGEARVDLYTGGPWTFDATTAGTVVAALFNRWAYVTASYDYASKRGFASGQENEFRAVMEEAIAEMTMFKADPMPGADGPDEDTEDDEPVGMFQMVEVERDPVCVTDEFSSD